MPRIAVDTASAGLLSGEVDMSTASIAQMVKENVDLEKTFGVSSQFAETLRGAYEELADSTGRVDDLVSNRMLHVLCGLVQCVVQRDPRPHGRRQSSQRPGKQLVGIAAAALHGRLGVNRSTQS